MVEDIHLDGDGAGQRTDMTDLVSNFIVVTLAPEYSPGSVVITINPISLHSDNSYLNTDFCWEEEAGLCRGIFTEVGPGPP